MTAPTNISGKIAAETIRVRSGQIDSVSTLPLAVVVGVFRFAQHIILQSRNFGANKINHAAAPLPAGRKERPLPDTHLLATARLACAALFALALSGCATRSVSPGPTIADMTVRGTGNEPSRTVFERSVETFALALQESAAIPDDPTMAAGAFRAGRAVLDLQCERYIDAVGSVNQSASNERKQVSLIGGFTSAIMGLTGSGAKEIAGVATTFSFAGSSMDAYTSAYLFSDAAKSVSKIVREGQGAYLTAVQGQLSSLSYADSVALLVGYEAICRPAQIRALIDEAVARGTVMAERPGGERVGESEVASILVLLRGQLGHSISEDEAVVLYAWYRASSTLRDKIAGRFEPAKSLVAQLTPATLDQRLTQAFLPLSLGGSAVAVRWSAPAAEIARAADPPSAAPPGIIAAPAAPPGIKAAPAAPRILRIPILTVR